MNQTHSSYPNSNTKILALIFWDWLQLLEDRGASIVCDIAHIHVERLGAHRALVAKEAFAPSYQTGVLRFLGEIWQWLLNSYRGSFDYRTMTWNKFQRKSPPYICTPPFQTTTPSRHFLT